MGVRADVLTMGLGPPKLAITEAIGGWAAMVLAVTNLTRVSHVDLLRHEGRSSKALADARRLLVWAFLEVSDSNDDMSIAWLEQCMDLGRRSILDGLRGDPPEQLQEAIKLYSRLARAMGAEDVQEAVVAGLLGERKPRARVWPKGFLARLGLADD